jgi:hypothetical protein
MQTIGLTAKIVAFSSMMMSAAMALNAFKSLGSIWNDEDATFGEKIL